MKLALKSDGRRLTRLSVQSVIHSVISASRRPLRVNPRSGLYLLRTFAGVYVQAFFNDAYSFYYFTPPAPPMPPPPRQPLRLLKEEDDEKRKASRREREKKNERPQVRKTTARGRERQRSSGGDYCNSTALFLPNVVPLHPATPPANGSTPTPTVPYFSLPFLPVGGGVEEERDPSKCGIFATCDPRGLKRTLQY